MADDMPFLTRLWFAFACFFRVLIDPAFASRAFAVRDALPAAPEPGPGLAGGSAKAAEPAKVEEPAKAPVVAPKERDLTPALQLLALLQREGRFLDFVEQDVDGFTDADIGAAARVVHEGCRRAVRGHLTLAPVRSEAEGSRVTLAAGFSPHEVKLTGNVQGQGPFTGTLVHRGWRGDGLRLPVPVQGFDGRILAPAEVEL